MSDLPDIDIDVADHNEAVAALPEAVVASQLVNDTIKPHSSGIYLQKIPVNPLNGLAVYPYKYAEELGFIKLDLLNNRVYQSVESQEHLHRLMNEPIDWEWFKNVDFVAGLFHFGHRWADMVVKYEPQSILDIACLLAVIRPAKIYLIGESWEIVREKIWIKEPPEHGEDKRFFKKSHAVAYAQVVGIDARLKAKKFFDTVAL